jgi:hypothetical protein
VTFSCEYWNAGYSEEAGSAVKGGNEEAVVFTTNQSFDDTVCLTMHGRPTTTHYVSIRTTVDDRMRLFLHFLYHSFCLGQSPLAFHENGLVLYSVTSEVTSGLRLYPGSYELRVTRTSGFRCENIELW